MKKIGLTAEEIKKHSSHESCWIVIHGNVFDVTDFLPEHPGGQAIILKYAGADATEAYDPIHPPGTIEEYLPTQCHKGKVIESDMKLLQIPPQTQSKQASTSLQDQEGRKEADPSSSSPPPLSSCLSLYDFESIASTRLSKHAWAYYSSGSDDEISLRENRACFQRIWFRPRILRNVSNINFSTKLLNSPSSMPVYITATALGKLGHPEGEKNLTLGAGTEGIIQMIPTLSSCSFDELIQARVSQDQAQWLQVYVNRDRSKTEKLIRKAESNQVKAIFITVDAPQLGRREKDMRLKFEDLGADLQNQDRVDRSQGASRAISSFIDPSLSWADIPWFKTITKLPILLKGVQCWEDAVLARQHGLQGIVLSNHGGRQLDYSRSGIEILIEVVDQLKKRSMWNPDQFEVYLDGGIRRAGDVIKALCLGAKAVGIGRPFLYAYSVYGHQGVIRAIQILKDELEMNMRLIGASSLEDLEPGMIDISSIKNRVVDTIPDFKVRQNYEPLPQIKNYKL